MSTCSLPFPVRQTANGYQFYAFVLGITSLHRDGDEWLLSNYVQLIWDEGSHVRLCFYIGDYAASPLVETIRLTQPWLKGSCGPDILAFIRRQVRDGYYVYLNVDEFYIPHRRIHQVTHASHDILVRGFDDEAGTLEVVGFDADRAFASHTIPQEAFTQAWSAHQEMDSAFQHLHLYRLLPDAHYTFNPEQVAAFLQEYVSGANTALYFGGAPDAYGLNLYKAFPAATGRVYGLRVYEVLQRRLTAHLAGEGSIDIRDVHVFWEHKALMVARLERIARDIPLPGALIQEARELEVQAKSLYLAYMMHEVAPERGGLERLVAELPRTRRRDAALCQALLEAIASSRTGGDQECR